MARPKTITIGEILVLLKKQLDVVVTRPTIYSWMRKKDFPPNGGLGVPRRWRLDQVTQWIKKYESPPATRKK